MTSKIETRKIYAFKKFNGFESKASLTIRSVFVVYAGNQNILYIYIHLVFTTLGFTNYW